MRSLEPWKLELGGTALIEASAGTGKTFTLTTLYLRLLVERDLLPSQILVVTYTQAATAELRQRVRDRIQQAIRVGEEPEEEARKDEDLLRLALEARRRAEQEGRSDPLRRALQEFDEAAIYTIHGFCQRTLQENAFESGTAFDAELVEQAEPLERTLARDLWARALDGEDPLFVEWLQLTGGRRWQFEPDALYRNLLSRLGADEEMPVLPARDADPEEVDLDALYGACRAAWVRWAEAWQVEREARVAWLLDSENLNQRTYAPKKLKGVWLPWLEEWAGRISGSDAEHVGLPASVAAQLPAWWKHLSPEGLAKGLKKNGTAREDVFFEACGVVAETLGRIEAAFRARALEQRRWVVEEVRAQSRRRRDERHLLFFDDLLCELRRALRGAEGDRLIALLQERHRFALIDEFQDTDPVQYEIFRTVWHRDPGSSEPRGLLLIGDPKQAIYSFRGADVFTYLKAREDAANETWGLEVNYRSDPGLITALNTLFEAPTQAFGLEAIDFHPVRPRPEASPGLEAHDRSEAGLRVVLAEAEAAAAQGEGASGKLPLRFGRTVLMEAFARDVADLLESSARIEGRPIRPSDIAVLCRKKKELVRAREALTALGIPCVDRGDQDIFESREAWELACVLRAMLRSGDPASLRAALSTAAHGLDASALVGLEDDSPELSAISERYAEYARIWAQSGFAHALETWRRKEAVLERLLVLEDGERRLTNWLHLTELLQGVALDRSPSRSSLVRWLERAIADEAVRHELGADATLLRLERDDQAVSLVTLHRSKGLQYEIVYLPCLWEGSSTRFPNPDKARNNDGQNPPLSFHDAETHRRSLDLGGPGYADHVVQAIDEERSEQLRLLYVGLTRAKRQCSVFWGAIGKHYAAAPLAWLLDAQDAEREGLDRDGSAKKIAEWNDEQWKQAWRGLADAAGDGAISIEIANWEPRGRISPLQPEPSPLRYDPPRRRPPSPQMTTSFSGLVRNALGVAWSGPVAIGRDLDAEVEVELESGSERGEGPDLAGGMDTFPRGAEAGTLLHEVLEDVDFASPDEEALGLSARAALERNGLDPRLDESVLHVVRSVARTPLRTEPSVFRLADVARGQLLCELEFTLAAPGEGTGRAFEPATLAAVLEAAPTGSPLARYASRAARLGWRELRGYLRGFIDAVFCDGERYFLIDYKSNHLGATQADYRPERLIAPMIEHDYVLQYLIYSVALDRHLARSLPDYEYDRHFGGVYYLFLRGLAVEHEPGCGVFFDRPDGQTIASISELLGAALEAGR